IAGGLFTAAGGISANHIAKWDGANWAPLGSGIGAPIQSYSPIVSMTVFNGELVVGGWFNSAGGASANYIAKWDGVSWSPLSSGMNLIVDALTVFNGELIAGGNFTTAGGVGANRIAKWNGTNWAALSSGMRVGDVHTLTDFNSELIVGGTFTTA